MARPAAALRTPEEKTAFRERRAAWVDTHLDPVAAGIRDWASKAERGQPPAARVYLRDVVEHADALALAILGHMVGGVVRQEGLTALASNVGRGAAKVCDKPLESDAQAIQVGYALLSIVCQATGAAAIVDKHGDRPEKAAGGVKLSPSYELRINGGGFLQDAVRFGAVGMPTFCKKGPAPWTGQQDGGVRGQEEHGMVHGAGRQMRDVTPDTAPILFDAVNAAQRARFRVNPVTAAVVQDYDAAKAYEWLLARFLAAGMEEAKAQGKAREAARL